MIGPLIVCVCGLHTWTEPFGQHLALESPDAIMTIMARNKATMRKNLTADFEEAIEQMDAPFFIPICPCYL